LPSPAATPTEAVVFTEVVRVEKSMLTPTSTTSGTCDKYSSRRADVWRCGVELDGNPSTFINLCLSETPDDTFVLCATDWYGGADAIRVDLAAPLAPSSDDDVFTAMAVELDDGVRCSFTGGATFTIDDQRANFACDDDSWLMGNPSIASDGAWTWQRCRSDCGGESPSQAPLETARATRVWG
jgi:hypothetical protein